MGKKRKISPLLILRLLGIILFIYILSKVDIHSIWQDLKSIEIGFLIWGIIFQIVMLFVKATRWHLLIDGRKNKQNWIFSFGAFFESYALGVITPGRMGEVVKAGHKVKDNSVVDSGMKIVVERGFDMGFFLLFAGLAFLFSSFLEDFKYLGFLSLAMAGLLILLSMLLLISQKTTQFTNRLAHFLTFKKVNLNLVFTKRTNFNVFLLTGLSVVSNLLAFLSCYMLALGLSLNESFIVISGGVAIAGFFNLIPITIMGLGTREAVFLFLFQAYPQPLILAFSGAVFFVAQIGGGIVSMIMGQLLLQSDRKNKIKPTK
jgi:glycosyltransferase 2 family protein